MPKIVSHGTNYLSAKIEYSYIDGILSARKTYFLQGNTKKYILHSTTKYEYNEFLDIVKESIISHISKLGTDIYTYSYIYDDDDNWRFRLIEKNGIATYKTTRFIDYYNSENLSEL